MWVPVLLGASAGVTTAVGGVVAMRVADRRHLVLGLAGGVILGVIAFDLLSEAVEGSTASLKGVPASMVVFVAARAMPTTTVPSPSVTISRYFNP